MRGRVAAVAVALPFGLACGLGLSTADAAPSGRVELTFSDPAIVESSGLVALDDLVVTVNDSGDTGRVFSVERDSGDTVGVTTWSDDPTDVEAIAPAGDRHPGEVWVADIGDNAGARDSVSVTRVPVGRGDRDVRGEVATYELVYPDGPADAETLLVEPSTGRLVVVTKGIFGGEVLLAPARLDPDGPNRMRSIGAAGAVATDGSFWPDGQHVVVRSYSVATVYTWPGLERVGRFDLPEQQQGEGIAVDRDGVVLVSSEGVGSEVLRLRLPGEVRRAVGSRQVRPTEGARPTEGVRPTEGARPTEGVRPTETARPAEGSRQARPAEQEVWWWAVGGLAGLVAVGVVGALVRTLRPRG